MNHRNDLEVLKYILENFYYLQSSSESDYTNENARIHLTYSRKHILNAHEQQKYHLYVMYVILKLICQRKKIYYIIEKSVDLIPFLKNNMFYTKKKSVLRRKLLGWFKLNILYLKYWNYYYHYTSL